MSANSDAINRSDGIEEIEEWIAEPLPEPYRAFLAAHPHDLFASDIVLLYGRNSFVERNETYETKTYCPGYVTIGDDNGGRQFLLSLDSGAVAIVDAGAMTPDVAHPVSDDFAVWLTQECPLPAD